MKKKVIIIGVPCYNEEDNILHLYKKIVQVTDDINKYSFKYLFVDNCSTDKTVHIVKKLAKKDKKVIGIILSRNFGPEASGKAVFDHAHRLGCDALITIPCDFQDPPELIPKFIKEWEKGYLNVVGTYTKNHEDKIISFLRRSFYSIFQKISNINVPVNASGVGLIDKKVISALVLLPEKFFFYRGLRSWVGFKTTYVLYEKQKRLYGLSSYRSIFDYVKDAEHGLFGFSYLILDVMVYAGFILTILSLIFIIVYITFFLLFGNPIKGAVTILVAIVFFGGVNLMAISVIGKYIQVIVEETKNRPVYIVDDTINFHKTK